MEGAGVILSSKAEYLMNAGCCQKSIESHNHNFFDRVALKVKENILHDVRVNFVKKLPCVRMYSNRNSCNLGN